MRKKQKLYQNGLPYEPGSSTAAKESLMRKWGFQPYDNFGPNIKGRPLFKETDRYVFENYEFTIVEYECFGLVLNNKGATPRIESAAYYQPLINTQN